MATHSSTLDIVCEELTHWKRLWCWEGLGARGEADDRGWDGWMASLTRWTWVWVNSGSWWWTGMPGVLRFMGSQRVGHNWATDLNWSERKIHLRAVKESRPKRRKEKRGPGLNFGSSFCMFFSPPPGPALCKLGWPGVLFVLPEVLTLVLGLSFVLFSWVFIFLVF